jgi:hypothetical protein
VENTAKPAKKEKPQLQRETVKAFEIIGAFLGLYEEYEIITPMQILKVKKI